VLLVGPMRPQCSRHWRCLQSCPGRQWGDRELWAPSLECLGQVSRGNSGLQRSPGLQASAMAACGLHGCSLSLISLIVCSARLMEPPGLWYRFIPSCYSCPAMHRASGSVAGTHAASFFPNGKPRLLRKRMWRVIFL
jgi:hypothetical protein